MVRSQGVDPKPLMTEIPDSSYVLWTQHTEGASCRRLPFSLPDAPHYNGVPVLDGPPPEGSVPLGPVEGDLAGQINDLLGID